MEIERVGLEVEDVLMEYNLRDQMASSWEKEGAFVFGELLHFSSMTLRNYFLFSEPPTEPIKEP
jgi:hypothetical protein